MKKLVLWMGVVLLATSPAMAMAVIDDGTTYQCWSFTDQPYGDSFAFADQGYLNRYGKPTLTISDMSQGQDLQWNQDGFIEGTAFKIIIDIPNTSITTPNSYKNLTIAMRYQGDISFLWMADAVTGSYFTPTSDPILGEDGNWKTYSRDWYISPNPQEEAIFIGFTGTTAPAALDQICIDTICVPEPAMMTLLVLGAGCVLRRKR